MAQKGGAIINKKKAVSNFIKKAMSYVQFLKRYPNEKARVEYLYRVKCPEGGMPCVWSPKWSRTDPGRKNQYQLRNRIVSFEAYTHGNRSPECPLYPCRYHIEFDDSCFGAKIKEKEGRGTEKQGVFIAVGKDQDNRPKYLKALPPPSNFLLSKNL